MNSLPHPEMRGKVDLTRILDLILNPTPVNDAMGEVFLLAFFINAGPVEVHPMDKPYGDDVMKAEVKNKCSE